MPPLQAVLASKVLAAKGDRFGLTKGAKVLLFMGPAGAPATRVLALGAVGYTMSPL